MPRNVRWFAWLWIITFLMTFLALPLLPQPDASTVKLGVTRSVEMAIGAGAIVILFAIFFPFFWLAVWRRRNWARWLLAGTFVLSLPLLFVDHPFRADNLPLTVFGLVQGCIQALGFYFLFSGDAQPWFRP
jgi:hypothetical protein